MRNWILSAFLFLAVLAAAPLHAEGNDPFKDIKMYGHPKDFEVAKQLALQNRVERMDRIKDVMTCIRQAKAMDDIYACQETEADYTAKIRLAYCDTGVSWLYLDARKGSKKNGKKKPPTECQKALQAIENIKKRRSGLGDGQTQGATE
ncbi:MAG: hypothetical protein HY053_03130 [Proteobacteria bacterium]|nr:hypothetical protein [Pseudomonadota bacterium]